MKYRIAWKSKKGKTKGHGSFAFKRKSDAEEWVKRLNAEYPDLFHWVESESEANE
jgi:hypothetical protein